MFLPGNLVSSLLYTHDLDLQGIPLRCSYRFLRQILQKARMLLQKLDELQAFFEEGWEPALTVGRWRIRFRIQSLDVDRGISKQQCEQQWYDSRKHRVC